MFSFPCVCQPPRRLTARGAQACGQTQTRARQRARPPVAFRGIAAALVGVPLKAAAVAPQGGECMMMHRLPRIAAASSECASNVCYILNITLVFHRCGLKSAPTPLMCRQAVRAKPAHVHSPRVGYTHTPGVVVTHHCKEYSLYLILMLTGCRYNVSSAAGKGVTIVWASRALRTGGSA